MHSPISTGHAFAMQAIAQRQMHAAWSSRPKIQVHLDLHAPKVAMPISTADGTSPSTTLIIDLGSLIIASNPVEAASLSPEEAAIYDCYGLVSYDVAVHLVRGRFAWPDMKSVGSGHGYSSQMHSGSLFEKQPSRSRASLDSKGSCRMDFKLDDYLSEGALAVPLLGHCSTTASVHVAQASHPTLPTLRIGLQVCYSGSLCVTSHLRNAPAEYIIIRGQDSGLIKAHNKKCLFLYSNHTNFCCAVTAICVECARVVQDLCSSKPSPGSSVSVARRSMRQQQTFCAITYIPETYMHM